jgi:6-pyruvoyltetrahydropterin/6-carboxytetrahydropterin synthase
MMYKVKVVTRFAAAHFLQKYQGKCESLHGHNWKVEVTLCVDRLDTRDMVIDFKDLRLLLAEVVDEFDHKLLNDNPFFKDKNTTSERIAEYIYVRLNEKLTLVKEAKKACSRFALNEVAVWEQEDSCAVYAESEKL